MRLYKEFRPTAFDDPGAFLDDDRQDWWVVPVSQTRDSGSLDQSNFAAALEMLGGESETVEVHRFGHWGPGWFEIIIAAPSREADVQAIEDALENYPVLDDEDHSSREWEAFEESWANYGCKDFMKDLLKKWDCNYTTGFIEDILDEATIETLQEAYVAIANEPYFIDGSSGVCIRTDRAIEHMKLEQFIQLLWKISKPDKVDRLVISKWLMAVAEDLGYELPLPLWLQDSEGQRYLFPRLVVQERQYVRQLLGELV